MSKRIFFTSTGLLVAGALIASATCAQISAESTPTAAPVAEPAAVAVSADADGPNKVSEGAPKWKMLTPEHHQEMYQYMQARWQSQAQARRERMNAMRHRAEVRHAQYRRAMSQQQHQFLNSMQAPPRRPVPRAPAMLFKPVFMPPPPPPIASRAPLPAPRPPVWQATTGY